jgi:hypothetical protein
VPPLAVVAGQLDFVVKSPPRCQEEELFRSEVARRMGYDPFDANVKGADYGRVRIVVELRGGYFLSAAHVDPAGVEEWSRTYPVGGAGKRACEIATEVMAVELAAELTIFALNVPRTPPPAPPAPLPPPAPEPQPPPAPAPVEPVPPPASPAPPAPPPSSLRVRGEAGVGIFGAAGVTPAPTIGGTIHLGVAIFPAGPDRFWFSLALEGRADKAASSVVIARSAVRSSLLAVSPLACLHGALWTWTHVAVSGYGCVLGTVGSVSATIDGGTRSFALSGAYAGVGVRPGLQALVASRYLFSFYSEALATAYQQLGVAEALRDLAAPSRLSGGGGLAFAVVFP